MKRMSPNLRMKIKKALEKIHIIFEFKFKPNLVVHPWANFFELLALGLALVTLIDFEQRRDNGEFD